MLASIGMGLVFVPLTLIATSGVPVDDAGLASGLFNTSQQIGGALGLALLSTFAANKTADVLASSGGKPTDGGDRAGARRRLPHRLDRVRGIPRRRRRAAVRPASPRRRARRRARRGRAGRHRRRRAARVGCRREDRTVPDRAVLRRSRVHGAVHALVERRRVGQRPPTCSRSSRMPRSGSWRSGSATPSRSAAPELRAAIAPIYETVSPDDVVVVAAAEEGHLRRLPRAPRAGRPRGRRDPLLRVGAPGRALCRGDGDRVAALGERRLGARPRRPPDARCGRTRSSSTSTARTTRRECRCRGRCSTRVVELCAERGAWLFSDEVYRELEHDPADRLPAACDLYERALSLGSMSKTYGLPGAAARLARLPRRATRCSASSTSSTTRPSARAHRASSSARSRSGIATCSPTATAASCSRTCRCSTRSSSGTRDVLSWVRPTAGPIGFPRLHGADDATAFCEQLVAAEGVLLLPGAVYDEPGHVRVGFGRSCHARGAGAARALHRHTFLTLLKQRRNPDARFPNNLPIHLGADNTTPSRRGAAMGDGQRLTTWIEWYRFAREALELGHAEASSYATARYVEEQNRTQTREWRAA